LNLGQNAYADLSVKDDITEIVKTVVAWLPDWLKDNLKVQGAEISDLITITFLGKKLSLAGCN
jgi:hypothetical protein